MGTTYRRRDNIIARHIANETILVPIRGELARMERVYVLNRVGEQIWQQLDGIADLAAICDGIAAHFRLDPAQAEADVQEFIAQLNAADLILQMA